MTSPAAAFSVALLGFDVAGIDTEIARWLSPHFNKACLTTSGDSGAAWTHALIGHQQTTSQPCNLQI